MKFIASYNAMTIIQADIISSWTKIFTVIASGAKQFQPLRLLHSAESQGDTLRVSPADRLRQRVASPQEIRFIRNDIV